MMYTYLLLNMMNSMAMFSLKIRVMNVKVVLNDITTKCSNFR